MMKVRIKVVFISIQLLSKLLEGNKFLSFSKHPKLLWTPANLLLNVHVGRGTTTGAFYGRNIVPSISISGAMPLLPYTPSRRTERHLSSTASNCLSLLKSNVLWPSFCNTRTYQH